MGNKENKETKAMTHSVHMVQSLSFNHSNSCSLSREWYTYIDVDGTGIGGEIELQYGEDMEEFLWKSFSHNPILSLSIQELARCQNMSGKLHWRMLRNHIISCGKPRKQFKQRADLQDKFWFTVLHILLFQGALEITSVWMMITDEICWDHDHCSIERVTLFLPHHRKNTFCSSPSRLKLHLFHNNPAYLLKSDHIYLPLDDTSAFCF